MQKGHFFISSNQNQTILINNVEKLFIQRNREMKSALHNKGMKNIKFGSKVASINKQKKPKEKYFDQFIYTN